MADDEPKSEQASGTAGGKAATEPRRTIPGDFSYTTTPGKLKTALENLVNAERPEVFNKDFIETYLGVSGGSAGPIPTILKRTGFLGTDGRPTELYAKFQTESARAEAALEGLKRGFGELFKKNVYVHSLPEDKLARTLPVLLGAVSTFPRQQAVDNVGSPEAAQPRVRTLLWRFAVRCSGDSPPQNRK